ncbi:Uncharacterised protein [Neisseria animaloris]|uniref:hypothetical protein n=1 Tax=Neisseria animaloris TaxID=326522 RepID=UPI000A1974B0|nr:hypothetical protein [Neisseria animaloris]OSI08821.1 hypothetical protein BWD08_01525 [Neisseria animaloris]VEH87210.1 Uncharacterised protein [Neisseria animaloris]
MQKTQTTPQVQNPQTVQFIARIAVPAACYPELDATGCKWLSLGKFADRQAAEQAVKAYPKPYDAYLIQQA